MKDTGPFRFHTERRLVLLTGRRASDLGELLEGIEQVSGASIFYHTHHQFLSHHFERPSFLNDFAVWAKRALQQPQLAELLAAVDLLGSTTVRQVREQIAGVIRDAIAGGVDPCRKCPPDDLFHFCESQSFVMPTGLVAHDPAAFFQVLGRVSTISIFFHFFEARLRLGRPTNDFSLWLRSMGREEIARKIEALNPYFITLDDLRLEMLEIGKKEGDV